GLRTVPPRPPDGSRSRVPELPDFLPARCRTCQQRKHDWNRVVSFVSRSWCVCRVVCVVVRVVCVVCVVCGGRTCADLWEYNDAVREGVLAIEDVAQVLERVRARKPVVRVE